MSYNGFPMEISSEDQKISIFLKMDMDRKYLVYVAKAIKTSVVGYARLQNLRYT
jgi:hypothetical protein